MFCNLEKEDNVVKNMSREVVRECGQSGVNISADAATYLIHLKFLIPGNNFKEDRPMGRNFTQSIVQQCVNDFLQDSVWINTIKLQAFSEMNWIDREVVKENCKESAAARAKSLLMEIVETEPLDREPRDKLYKKMIMFTVLFSGLGQPSQNSALQEAQAALQSIFKSAELERFVALSQVDKEDQLMELMRIVSGIRLFNKDCQRGGESIEDMPLLLTQTSQKIRERIISFSESLSKRLLKLTRAAQASYELKGKVNKESGADYIINSSQDFTHSELEDLKRISFMVIEHRNCLRKVLIDLEKTVSSIALLIERFQETLLKLHEAVRYRSAVPIVLVYPLFIILSYIWEEMQGEAAVLSEIYSFVSGLSSIDKYTDSTRLEVVFSSEISEEIAPKMERDTKDLDPSNLSPGVIYITNKDPQEIGKFRYGGYCAWTLAAADGLLIPGNPEIGFIQYEGHFYAFNTLLEACLWGKDPDRPIKEVYKIARKNLELIKILDLYEDLREIRNDPFHEEKEGGVKQACSVQVQTVLHPTESYIDQNYRFSEWDLKREAMQLSRIINYQTKSQQTVNHSHFRASIGIQAEPSKSESTQTRRDNWCNHPSVSSYLFGLRGYYDDKFQALDLTRPVHEDVLPCNIFPGKNSGGNCQ